MIPMVPEFMLELFIGAKAQLPGALLESRMDSAFFSQDILSIFNGNRVKFTASVPFERLTQLKEMIESRKRWRTIDSQWSYFETAWKPKSWERGYRFIFTRKKTRKQHKGMLQLHIPIATGTIQKIVDRTSNALLPVYEHIGRIARRFWCNYIDETSWFKQNDLHWLWAMVNERVAFYRIDPHRSKEAFENLVRDWDGILVSDSYGLYRKWVNRQTCLAHLIRKADALAERKKTDLRRFGEIVAAWLRQLVSFAKEPPDSKQWSDFYTFFLFTVSLWEQDKTDAGKLARQIVREMDSLWTFLDHQGVEPTNNRAERALRFGVLWRKRSLGTQSEKGNRWVERILSLKETCRLNAKPTFPFLVECITSYFRNSTPGLSWI
jgi:transposase